MGMQDSINNGMNLSMDEMAAAPAVSEKVQGPLGKALRSVTAGAFMMTSAAMGYAAEAPEAPVQPSAEQVQQVQAEGNVLDSKAAVPKGAVGCGVGGVLGGVLGHQFGGGRGKDALTVLGALGGCSVGSQAETRAAQEQMYRQQQQQQAMNGGYPAPVYQGNAPQGNYRHPMTNYAPAMFGQWDGEVSPNRPLSPEAQRALTVGERMMVELYNETSNAQQRYAQAYEQKMKKQSAAYSPYNTITPTTNEAYKDSAYDSERMLNQASRERENMERRYVAGLIRFMDAGEFAASQGEDVRQFAHMKDYLSLPLVEKYDFTHPTTRAHFNVETTPQQPSRFGFGR